MSAACVPAAAARLPCRRGPCAPRRAPCGRGAAPAPSACAACRRIALVPTAPRAATPAAAHADAAAGGTRLRALPWLASAAAAAAPADDAALDAYLDTLKWDDKGLLVAIAQAREPAKPASRGAAPKQQGSANALRRSAERGHRRDHDAGLREPAGGEAHADDGQGASAALRARQARRVRFAAKAPRAALRRAGHLLDALAAAAVDEGRDLQVRAPAQPRWVLRSAPGSPRSPPPGLPRAQQLHQRRQRARGLRRRLAHLHGRPRRARLPHGALPSQPSWPAPSVFGVRARQLASSLPNSNSARARLV